MENSENYGTPLWYDAFRWLSIKEEIPKFKAALFKNQISPRPIPEEILNFYGRGFFEQTHEESTATIERLKAKYPKFFARRKLSIPK